MSTEIVTRKLRIMNRTSMNKRKIKEDVDQIITSEIMMIIQKSENPFFFFRILWIIIILISWILRISKRSMTLLYRKILWVPSWNRSKYSEISSASKLQWFSRKIFESSLSIVILVFEIIQKNYNYSFRIVSFFKNKYNGIDADCLIHRS